VKNISFLQYEIDFSFEVDDTVSLDKQKHNKVRKGQLHAKKYRKQYNTQTSDPLSKDVGIFDVKKLHLSCTSFA
jgi:hypothetical protein